MATIQIQKTANAGTMTKTAIDQKQSLEVVQTMLHGGVSSSNLLVFTYAHALVQLSTLSYLR